ncbi:MAG TPA: hypothetical protein VGC77_01435 [Rhodopseudomonas sp.]|uniref:hypothetical protein n=1 Tax=Rhodopseudomonas sp. TaxID=1078 RepID=UPI002EDB0043
MVEPIMYLAIGFLVSMLLWLMIVPLVHHRAVRLTTKRLEAAAPLSMAEIQADKDQLRAEFAMSARRLEMSVDQLKHKTTSQLAELGKKSDAINRLKLELGEKNAAIFALEAREAALNERLQATDQEVAAKTQALQAAEQALGAKQAELAKLSGELADRTLEADSRQVELVAVHSQIDALKARVGAAEKEFAATQLRLEQQRGESSAASHELADARERVTTLSQRVTELDRQLIAQVKEAETLGARAQQLERENAELRRGKAAPGAPVAALPGTPAASSDLEQLRAQKAALELELRNATEERAKLQRDLTAIHQQAETAWATERMENALLRERINDIAAEVAKLAMQLEGPDSTIQAILATAPAAPAAAPAKSANGAAGKPVAVPARGTLAERIRALQSQAARSRQLG